MDSIRRIFEESISTKVKILNSSALDELKEMQNQITILIQKGGKIMLCGNGGSAADAQHLAAEMLIRLRPNYNRKGVPAISLAQDSSTMTACSNDFGYVELYRRMVQTLGKSGDCLIALTTSGSSKNIINAMKEAKKMNIKVFGFLGCGGGEALKYCDHAFIVPSNDTGRIQEAHITAGHALMESIEDGLIEQGYLSLQDL